MTWRQALPRSTASLSFLRSSFMSTSTTWGSHSASASAADRFSSAVQSAPSRAALDRARAFACRGRCWVCLFCRWHPWQPAFVGRFAQRFRFGGRCRSRWPFCGLCLSSVEPCLFVIPGEDPGSSVEHCLLQRPAVRSGSRLKAQMTKRKVKLHRAESIGWGSYKMPGISL